MVVLEDVMDAFWDGVCKGMGKEGKWASLHEILKEIGLPVNSLLGKFSHQRVVWDCWALIQVLLDNGAVQHI